MATYLTEVNEQALHHFVTDSPWGFSAVRWRMTESALEKLPAEGRHHRRDGIPQAGEALGRRGPPVLWDTWQSGQLPDCTGYEGGVLPLNGELYLPESWTSAPDRLRMCRVPEGTPFQTNWLLAWWSGSQSGGWGDIRWSVVTDAAYGENAAFRAALTAKGHPQVVGVQGTMTV